MVLMVIAMSWLLLEAGKVIALSKFLEIYPAILEGMSVFTLPAQQD